MGGMSSCFAKKNPAMESETSKGWVNLQSGMKVDESLIQEAAVLLLQQRENNSIEASQVFDRSFSAKSPLMGKKKQQGLPRNASSRARSITDPDIPLQDLLNRERGVDDLETKKVVLVHGGGFGAWCWYKTMSLLADASLLGDAGFEVTAINLAGSVTHSVDANNITSLSEYLNPLITFLEKLGDTEKVILVGHDFGGTCISYAMEAFPAKIAKSVFLAAFMLKNGQRTVENSTNELMQQAQIFLYANGKDQTPTAISLETSLLNDLLFNQSPTKDIALASVSMRPIPFAPILEELQLTDNNYGSVRRFYIEATEDNALPLPLQQRLCESNPPEKVFRLKGSDHSPFFSKPQALHKILLEIAAISPNQNLKNL
ncbi:putative methylesterase 11, chloroplastic [Phalaenopsis equestris]|uniref:putative methylesterase 11, chloroplastic n=1 Tax=Phalaenopsis equestris TaxID=78828 RepID=UPI0009E1C29A|nr:putative methylesterase 11, chloroplastic [Phalaenopsis equestris]